MKLWCCSVLPLDVQVDSVGCPKYLGTRPLRIASAFLHSGLGVIQPENSSEWYGEGIYIFICLLLLRVSTSESRIPRPCFQPLKHRFHSVLLDVCCCHYYFRFPSSLISIHTTCISLSLRRTSAPIHLTSVLGVLGTQETFCILIAGLLERNIFDLYFPEFDKPLHLEAQHSLQE